MNPDSTKIVIQAIAKSLREQLSTLKEELLQKTYDPYEGHDPAQIADFSHKVLNVARQAPKEHGPWGHEPGSNAAAGGRKLYLRPVYEQYAKQHEPGLSFDQFADKVRAANRVGHLKAHRADLVEAMDPKMVASSAVGNMRGADPRSGSSFHLISDVPGRIPAPQQAPQVASQKQITPQAPAKAAAPAQAQISQETNNYSHLLPKHLQQNYSVVTGTGMVGPLRGVLHSRLIDNRNKKTVGFFHDGLDSPKLSASGKNDPDSKYALINAFNAHKQGK